jgi:hypothetical protein
MRFQRSSKVSHPASVVLDIMMNRMHEVVPFMPSIESIDLKEKTELGDGRVRIVRHWQGAVASLPAALRPFVPREALGWIDTAVWTPAEYKVDWVLTTGLSKFYDCAGTNYFEPHPKEPEAATRIRITGNLEVHASRLPAVPSFLASRITPQVEKFVVDMLAPNLTETAEGLQRYLDGKKGVKGLGG